MKSHAVVGVCWLVVGRWVREVSEPTAGCVLGWNRWPLEGEPLGLAAWEARNTLDPTMVCDGRHFLTECDFGFRIVFRIPWHATIVTVILLERYVWYGMI